ncbi:MAG TPA: GAF domain-containing protein [Dictyobacter sp.]|jgi:GAF domain-containing protein|nr:GAF domain-containing protein [Dictyobacter sp.]
MEDTTKNGLSLSLKDYYTPLYQAALSISSSLDIDQVLQSIVRSITEAMSAKASALRLLEPESGTMCMAASYGLSDEYLHKGPIGLIRSQIDCTTLENRITYIADVRTDERFQYSAAAAEEGLVSLLCVPLEVRGRTIGVLRVYTAAPQEFQDKDREFLAVLGSLAAQAIENARLYARVKDSYSDMLGAFWGTDLSLNIAPDMAS